MARRIEHHSAYEHPTQAVYRTLVDRTYLQSRLAVLGGTNAAVLEHRATTLEAAYRLRHGIEARNLPAVVRTVLTGDLTVERAETWHADSDGYAGTVGVTIPGMPGELNGAFRLVGTAAGSELRTEGHVRVPIPLVGGKVEDSVVGHLRALLDSERDFTVKWMTEHPA